MSAPGAPGYTGHRLAALAKLCLWTSTKVGRETPYRRNAEHPPGGEAGLLGTQRFRLMKSTQQFGPKEENMHHKCQKPQVRPW